MNKLAELETIPNPNSCTAVVVKRINAIKSLHIASLNGDVAIKVIDQRKADAVIGLFTDARACCCGHCFVGF